MPTALCSPRRRRLRGLAAATLLVVVAAAAIGCGGSPSAAPAGNQPRTAATASSGAAAPASARPSQATGPLKKVIMPISVAASEWMEYILAQQDGLYRKHGLDVQLETMGPAASFPALLKGEIQFNAAITEAIPLIYRGEPLRVVYVGTKGSVYDVVGGPHVTSLAQVAGQTMASGSTPGDPPDVLTRRLLADHGVRVADVHFAWVGTFPAAAAALESGRLAAATENLETSEKLAKVGYHILGTTSSIGYPVMGLVTTTAMISAHPHEVQDMVAALNDANGIILHDRSGTIAFLESRFHMDAAQAADIYRAYIPIYTLNPTPQQVQGLYHQFYDLSLKGKVKAMLPVGRVFDLSFMNALGTASGTAAGTASGTVSGTAP